ncbi:MAG: hypothetical protein ACLPNY_19460 [Roseiarcus sp.]
MAKWVVEASLIPGHQEIKHANPSPELFRSKTFETKEAAQEFAREMLSHPYSVKAWTAEGIEPAIEIGPDEAFRWAHKRDS